MFLFVATIVWFNDERKNKRANGRTNERTNELANEDEQNGRTVEPIYRNWLFTAANSLQEEKRVLSNPDAALLWVAVSAGRSVG